MRCSFIFIMHCIVEQCECPQKQTGIFNDDNNSYSISICDIYIYFFWFCYCLQRSVNQLRNYFREVSDEGTGEQLQPSKHLPLILSGDRPRVSTPAASWAWEEMRGGGGEGSGRLTKRDRVRWDRERLSTPWKIKDKGYAPLQPK